MGEERVEKRNGLPRENTVQKQSLTC